MQDEYELILVPELYKEKRRTKKCWKVTITRAHLIPNRVTFHYYYYEDLLHLLHALAIKPLNMPKESGLGRLVWYFDKMANVVLDKFFSEPLIEHDKQMN